MENEKMYTREYLKRAFKMIMNGDPIGDTNGSWNGTGSITIRQRDAAR